MTYRPRPVSGFPEHLPEIRMAELQMLDRIRATFESYGFASIETPSVEELEVLLAKGETDKEIYTIERLQADEHAGGDARLGLHYDLTVPFARYVAQHFNDLVFPFKRYQMQRVWRGERPQAGRFREFTQCDVDVIGIDNLAVTFDAELAAVAMQALDSIGVTGVTLHISNRKILNGFLQGLLIELRSSGPLMRSPRRGPIKPARRSRLVASGPTAPKSLRNALRWPASSATAPRSIACAHSESNMTS